jgi:two-component system response regulator YesN
MDMPASDSLKAFVNERILRRILRSFVEATGLRAAVMDTDGRVTVAPPGYEEGQPRFCQIIRTASGGLEKCQGSYARAGVQAAKFGEPYIFRCHAGLILWSAPIISSRKPVATIICGQVLMWEPEDFFWIEVSEFTRGLNVSLPRLIEAAKQLPVVSGSQVQAAADLLFTVGEYMMKAGIQSLRQERRITRQQMRLGEAIQAKKELELMIGGGGHRPYSLEMENQLVRKLKSLDKAGARQTLNDMLAELLLKNAGRPDVIKARALEIMVVLSRGAIEGGAGIQKLLETTPQRIGEILQAPSVEEVCFLVNQVLDEYLEEVVPAVGKHHQALEAAREFVDGNFDRPLGVEDIAKVAHLSPGYLSQVFRDELGVTIMEYLTRKRMDEAKKLLADPSLNISDVARRVGFSDPSYFTKVFKKEEFMTPTEYAEAMLERNAEEEEATWT